MTPRFLQTQIALGEDSKRQFKVEEEISLIKGMTP